MELIIIGVVIGIGESMFISSTVNALNNLKEQQKKLEKQNESKITSYQLESILNKEEDQERIQAKLKSIRAKLALGKKLTASELEFLHQHDPMMYMKAIKIEMSRRMMKAQIKNSKTKEEVQRIISNHMSGVRGTKEDIQMEQAAIADESGKAMKSKRYNELPATEEKRKEEKEEKHSTLYTNKKKYQEEQNKGNRFACKI